MGVAGFALARLARQLDHVGATLDELGQHRIHLGDIIEAAEAVGARAQLPRGLRAAQQQFADDAKLLGTEFQLAKFGVAESVLVAGNPGVEAGGVDHQPLADQLVHHGADIELGELQHRLAVALLVAGVDQCIKGEGILIRGADLFFNQTADDAGFQWAKY